VHNNHLDLLQLAQQLSQQKLASQASAAIGADARAMSYAGLCFASSALLLGLAKESYLPIAMIIGGLAFVLAAGIASYSARPVVFHMPGACYSDVAEDIEHKVAIEEVLRQLCGYSEDHIEKNKALLAGNAKLLELSQGLSFAAAVVSAVPQALSYYGS
jgi:hypothetical protein